MPTLTGREQGLTGGGQHAAAVVERLAVWIDEKMGRAALRPHLRPSTYINLAGGAAAVGVGSTVAPRGADEFVSSMGWHMTTKLWPVVEEYLTAPASTPPRHTPPPRQAPPPGTPSQVRWG